MFILRKKTLALSAAGFCAVLTLAMAFTEGESVPASLNAVPMPAPTLVIDAGHGGEDGGAVAEDGTVESGINLAVAQRLDALLCFLGYETKMTRTKDTALYSAGVETLREKKSSDLKNRVRLVNETLNAVLVSIHQNSLPSARSVYGAQVFYADSAESAEIAERVQSALNCAVNVGNEKSARQIERTVYLMRMVECPAILVECGFLSNAEETALLCEADYQRRLAVTIAAGCLSYIREAGEGS